MKCFVCEKEATLKDFTGVSFCSDECVIKNYKEDTKVIVDLLKDEGLIFEINYEVAYDE